MVNKYSARGTYSKVSIRDVARMAGVSIATVSRVINKSAPVRKESYLKVQEAIRKLKFIPSAFARQLATGTINMVALVIPRYEGIFYSFYMLELLRGIGTMCDVLKLDLLLHLTGGGLSLNLRGLGGVIFADIIGNHKQLESALEMNVPSVVINNYIQDLEVNCVSIDNIGGAREAVDYLIGLGHKKIAHITGDFVTQAARQRLQGYQAALQKKGIPLNSDYVVKTDYSRGQARQAAQRLFDMEPARRPTAIFVASDSMALEVMAVANARGIKIPQDVSIVGFDDNPSGLYGPVSLTTVKQPLIKMAQEGIRQLNFLMKRKKRAIEKIVLPAELVIRESCRPI
jgi:LacI family transcriptional regulator